MPRVYNDEGRYLRRAVELKFSFQLLGALGATVPTVIRDGQGAQVASITGVSGPGIQTITFRTPNTSPGFVLPRQLTYAIAQVHQTGVAANGALVSIVRDSYDPVAGTVQLVYRLASTGAAGSGALAAGDWVHVTLTGPDVDQFKDAA